MMGMRSTGVMWGSKMRSLISCSVYLDPYFALLVQFFLIKNIFQLLWQHINNYNSNQKISDWLMELKDFEHKDLDAFLNQEEVDKLLSALSKYDLSGLDKSIYQNDAFKFLSS